MSFTSFPRSAWERGAGRGTSRTLPRHFGSYALEIVLFRDGAHNPKSNKFRAGQPLGALGPVRVELDPRLVRAAPGATAKLDNLLVVPGPAAGNVGEALLRRQQHRLQRGLVRR